MATSWAELDTLQSTLNTALDSLKAAINAENLPPLSNYATEPHPLDDTSYLVPKPIYHARNMVLASLGELKHLVQTPYDKGAEQVSGGFDTAALDVFIRGGIVDEMMKAPPSQGIALEVLAKNLDMDPTKVATVLRTLSYTGWIYEVTEGQFALQRSAYALKKDTPTRDFPEHYPKYYMEAAIFEQMTHPEYRHSKSGKKTAFQIGKQTDLSCFEYTQAHPEFLDSLGKAIKATSVAHDPYLFVDFPWNKFSDGVYVDIGGGFGSLSIGLAKKLPKSTFVVQDLPQVAEKAKKIIQQQNPEAAKSGRLLAEGHDFFKPQPRSANVYMFRHVLHDWPDNDVESILKNTLNGAPPDATILVMENIAIPSTVNTNPEVKSEDSLPPFMPATLSTVTHIPALLGFRMMGLLNSSSRTLLDYKKLFEASGLKLVQTHSLRGYMSVMECKKI